MKASISSKVKGATVVEVLIAMAILAFCSGLATLIFLNIQKSTQPFIKLKAVELTERMMNETEKKRGFNSKEMDANEFLLSRSVETMSDYPDCKVVRVIIFNRDKRKLFELERVFYIGN